ncbi:cytochrome c oxidase assembly protein [Steroidobacter sp. S1-65]|uniref:Cytochrome c oxidase assembly protein n=1 Tax=Steroidobacter gossypii TaxID=2805490 RepID=A0ABS1X498_9GAMM|nr:cytochrome c oxidase assembly protein [Steroidobacter gossypii]MBM0108053.1 cytochrome c oxidase assembly protein [Steroidobacter gossypii]
MFRLIVLAICLAAPALCWSHPSAVPHEEPGWTLTAEILVPLALSLFLYAYGGQRLFRRSNSGRSTVRRRGILFAVGWFTLAAAAVSPLHEAGESSFTLHMVEHELLMLLAAPLLVLSRPLETMLWAWPAPARKIIGRWVQSAPMRGTWKFLSGGITATVLQAAVLWLWHAPTLFELALATDGWHITQHLSFLISALLFWSAMFHNKQAHGGRALAVLCLFATSVVSGALGALMALSQSPWYPRYAQMGLAPFGLTPVEDQQLAGLLMWIPGGLVHAVAALILLGALLRDSADRAPETLQSEGPDAALLRFDTTVLQRFSGATPCARQDNHLRNTSSKSIRS